MNATKLILLVEDNKDDEDLTLRALSKSDLATDVAVVRDGAEAIDFLFATGTYASRGASELPQVVLLDLNLPKLTGLDVLRQIRGNDKTRSLPVVMMTSSKQHEDIARSYELGANSYVQKPIDFKEFGDVVKTLGAYWLLVNEPAPAS